MLQLDYTTKDSLHDEYNVQMHHDFWQSLPQEKRVFRQRTLLGTTRIRSSDRIDKAAKPKAFDHATCPKGTTVASI